MPLSQVADYARRSERLGYDGMTVSEGVHDGFLNSLAALDATSELKVATSIILAFPRSPMVVAYAAWDLSAHTGGRFILGMGSQIRANIVDRYSTPWAPPVPRMREYVQSLRAIWNSWQHNAPLEFEGKHYHFTRMQPFFNPGPIEHPDIPVFLAAVGPHMTRLVGEVADGIHTHPSNSDRRMVVEHTLPLIAEGAKKTGRSMDEIEVVAFGHVLTGANEAEVSKAREEFRRSMAVMWSTPNYWKPLQLRGWDELGPSLRQLTRQGKWEQLPSLVTDDIIDELVPVATYAEIAGVMKEMWGGLPVSVRFPMPEDPKDDREVAKVLAELRG
jgi:probable F420-dependent oxidoreductase